MRGYRTYNSTPTPGDLRHRITIGYTERETNANGFQEPHDVVLCKVWASADDAGENDIVAADARNLTDIINFTIRYREDVKVGMWVEFEGKRRTITSLGNYSFKKEWLGMKTACEKAV